MSGTGASLPVALTSRGPCRRPVRQCAFSFQAAIRKELNEYKSNEMEVHASSKHLTRSGFCACGV